MVHILRAPPSIIVIFECSGVIGGHTGAAHGAICGALLPHVLRAIGRRAPSDRLTEVLGWITEEFDADDGVAALEAWMHASGLPRPSELGLESADHMDVAEASAGSSSMRASPVEFTTTELCGILAAAG